MLWTWEWVLCGDVVPLCELDGVAAVVDGHDARTVQPQSAVSQLAAQRRVWNVRQWDRRSTDEVFDVVLRVVMFDVWNEDAASSRRTETATLRLVGSERRRRRNEVADGMTKGISTTRVDVRTYNVARKKVSHYHESSLNRIKPSTKARFFIYFRL